MKFDQVVRAETRFHRCYFHGLLIQGHANAVPQKTKDESAKRRRAGTGMRESNVIHSRKSREMAKRMQTRNKTKEIVEIARMEREAVRRKWKNGSNRM